MDCNLSGDFPGKNTGVDCHFLLQRNLPDPGIEPRSPTLQADARTSEPPGKHDSNSSGSHLHRPAWTRVAVSGHLSWKELWIHLWEHDVESEFNSDSYKVEKDFRFIILTNRPSDWTI